MKIALDFDGVTAYTTKLWVQKFNDRYGKEVTTRAIDQWGFYEPLGITLNDCMELFSETWRDWQNLEPMEQDMWQKTKMLCNLGKTDIVTNAKPEAKEYLEMWLTKHNIHYNELVFSDKKWELDYNVFIDDSPSNIEKIYDAGKVALVYNHAWNRHMVDKSSINNNPLFGGIKRVYNMYHAIDILRNIKYHEKIQAD